MCLLCLQYWTAFMSASAGLGLSVLSTVILSLCPYNDPPIVPSEKSRPVSIHDPPRRPLSLTLHPNTHIIVLQPPSSADSPLSTSDATSSVSSVELSTSEVHSEEPTSMAADSPTVIITPNVSRRHSEEPMHSSKHSLPFNRHRHRHRHRHTLPHYSSESTISPLGGFCAPESSHLNPHLSLFYHANKAQPKLKPKPSRTNPYGPPYNANEPI
ncbi:hypothetical protein DL96DRAFT_70646 [Flagelloscypha sp. PMI_526]|nr:hypothetical protein DL96DRAFT_70646 [Flagelloscypha sp. PMI_526]